MFPWGVVPLEDDGLRSAKPMYQLLIQMLIEHNLGYLNSANPNVNIISVLSESMEDRVAEILGHLEEVKQGGGLCLKRY